MYTYTYTRTSVLVDQVDLFLRAAGIDDSTRKPVVDAISERWLDEVGVFIEDDGERVLEGALQISWSAHSDHADLTVSFDLPGWTDGAAPEITVLAKRLREYAESKNLSVSFWVVFTKTIREDPELYDVRRKKVGVDGPPPPWKKTPREQRIPLQDLPEAHVVLRDAR
jgi:hypothetical protein